MLDAMTPRSVTSAGTLAATLALMVLLSACGTSAPPGGGAAPQTVHPGGSPRPGASGDVSADRFNGQTGKEILAALGEPDYRRHEAPAEVWQYYGRGCVLDLFLYNGSGGQRVSYVELRSRNFNADPASDCLPLLLQGKRQPAG